MSDQNYDARFPCPNCGTMLSISLEALLNSNKVTCPSCNTELRFSPDQALPSNPLNPKG